MCVGVIFLIVLCFPQSSLDSPLVGNQITAGKEEIPNGQRYKAHFTYLGTTSATAPQAHLLSISVHHYSNPDPTPDLTYHTNSYDIP